MIGAVIWKTVTSKLAGPVASAVAVLLALALVAALMAKGGAEARAARLLKDRDDWRSASRAWQSAAVAAQASFKAAEKLRAAEHGRAVVAVTESAKACDARVASARRSAAAIANLVNREVPRDPQGCPVRSIHGVADGVSDALQAPTTAARPR